MAKPVVLDTLPEVRLLEDITRESAARLITELSYFKGTRVALSIFSNGGDVHGSQAVAAYIGNKANEMQVEARIYGNAASGAMIIAAACQTAYISSGAFALIHKARAVGPDGVIADADLPKEEKAVLDAMNAEQVALFQKRTGKTAASIEKLMEADRDMPAEEAADLGFFDGIIPQAMKLAAFKQIPAMAEDKKNVTFKVSAGDIAKAVISGEINVPSEQVIAAGTAEVAAKDAEIVELKAKLATAEAEKATLEAAKTTAEATTATEVLAKTTLEAENVTLRAEKAAVDAVIVALKKTPLVAQTLPDGTSVVIPGGDVKETVKLSAAESHFSRTRNYLAEYDKRKQSNN